MAYTTVNFPSKAAAKRALANGEEFGVFNPGAPLTPPIPRDFTGQVAVEGPHYPKPHRWYAEATVENGVVVKLT